MDQVSPAPAVTVIPGSRASRLTLEHQRGSSAARFAAGEPPCQARLGQKTVLQERGRVASGPQPSSPAVRYV